MTKTSNILTTEFELHFAAEAGTFSGSFAKGIRTLGFRDDHLIGQGVVFGPNDPNGKMSCPLTGLHVSWETFERDEFLRQRTRLKGVLTTHECVGYAHGEVIRPEWDRPIALRPYEFSGSWPFAPFESRCTSRAKTWDVHVSADRDSLDPRVADVLLNKAQMYYIDLRKRSGRVARIFTIQGSNAPVEGLRIFEEIWAFLTKCGGLAGSVKYERACYWRECGKPSIVPPVISAFPLPASTTRSLP